MNNRRLYGIFGAMALLSIAATAAPSAALPPEPAPSDARWNALIGCWQPEAVDGAPAHVICVLPGSGESVTIATIADGTIVSEQAITADGARRAVTEGGCSGYETASWSRDGRRVFLRSDLNCGGEVQRVSTGVLALVSPASYVDVQSVTVDGQQASRTVRYVALPAEETPAVVRNRLQSQPMATEAARIRASAPLDFEDVVEASAVLNSGAVEGLLVARRAGFDLNADRLRTLAATGVSSSTVDVMVALSFPDHFAVAEEEPRERMARGYGWDDRLPVTRASCYDPYDYGGWNSRYSRCGYRSYYSPFGYDRYGWGYGTRPVVVVTRDEVDTEQGTVVKGRGYTRTGTSTGTAKPRATARPAATPARAVDGGRDSGTTSSGEAKPRTSGTDTGRTAKPRGGN